MIFVRKLVAVIGCICLFSGLAFAQTQGAPAAAESVSNALNGLIGIEKAEEIALGQVADGILVSSKLEKDGAMSFYEVNIVNDTLRYSFEMNAEDGAVLEFTERPLRVGQDQSATGSGPIYQEDAEVIALEKAGSGTVYRIERDSDIEATVYKVHIRDADYLYSVEVERATGAILAFTKQMR
ncbi:MAG: PepSY domain-containing protein [Spirochaetaceae bacterium]|jgi:uncharacterized membrane protein YkoI|nr:PepSY domain-containing protein [Spirochaetaceae bacterium]